MFKPLAISSIVLLTAGAAAAEGVDVDVSGEYRPRAELDHRFGDNADFFVTHRARASINAKSGRWSVFIQPQDVRTWGTEPDTLRHGNGVDLHQGYVDFDDGIGYRARVGRQEIIYFNHRLIGNVDWTQQGRSFDAGRLGGRYAKLSWDLFAAPLSQATGDGNQDKAVAAAHVAWSNAGRTLAAIAVSDWYGAEDFYRWTFGPFSQGKLFGPLGYEVEAYWQQSHAPGADARKAYLVAGQLNAGWAGTAGKPRLALGYERLSGNDNEDWVPFDTLFATNHKFYGYMDFFTNLPVHTGGAGLQDIWGLVGGSISKLDVQLMGHRFLTETDILGPLSFGTEWDLVCTWKFRPNVALQVGYGVMFAGDALKTVREGVPETPTWGYGMLSAKL